MARTRKWGGKVGFGGLGAAAILVLAPASAGATVTCAYNGLGIPGLPNNTLTATMDSEGDSMTIIRSGSSIVVKDDNLESSVTCSGVVAPTVTNTDTIQVQTQNNAPDAFAAIDLAGGPFAPGATDEGDGSSEIEFDLQLPGEEDGAVVVGSSARDHLVLGSETGKSGINLNAGEANPDVDVQIDGADVAVLLGRGGNDLLSAAGGFGFDAPLRRFAFLSGGTGNDRLTGGTSDDVLLGGDGNDRLDGRAGGDILTGGKGRDRMFGGAGDDALLARHSGRDSVHCGHGNDVASIDRHDRARGCEQLSRGADGGIPF
jgi:hypothetical protein